MMPLYKHEFFKSEDARLQLGLYPDEGWIDFDHYFCHTHFFLIAGTARIIMVLYINMERKEEEERE